MRALAPLVTVVVVLTVALAAITPAAALGSSEAPLADAGLDQTVEQGTTVHLDATGSRDPDGRITGHEWTITAPDGTPRLPAGFTDPRTSFVPTQPGRYEVTLLVTDDAGHTTSDTLYVDVTPASSPPSAPPSSGPSTGAPSAPGPSTGSSGPTPDGGPGSGDLPPRVEILGPSTVPPGESVTYEVRATDPDGSITRREMNHATAGRLADATATTSTSSITRYFSPRDAGRTVTVSASVEDSGGNVVTATKRVRVRTRTEVPPLSIVGPSNLRSGESGTWSISSFEGNFESYDWNIEYGTNDGSSASDSWTLPNGTTSRQKTVSVTAYREDGSVVSDSKTVRIYSLEQPSPLYSGELDKTDKRGFEGVLRGLNEFLTGEEAQMARGSSEYVHGDDAARTSALSYDEFMEAFSPTESEDVHPNTLTYDDQDGGVMDDASRDLYETGNSLRRSGDATNEALTASGRRFEDRMDETGYDSFDASREAGSSVDRFIDESGDSTGDTVEEGYRTAGEVVGSAVSGIVSARTGSDLAGHAADTAISEGSDAVGSAYDDGIDAVSNTVGDSVEEEIENAGAHTGVTGIVAGDAGQFAADTVGDIGEGTQDVGADTSDFLGDTVETAEDTISDILPGSDGEGDTESGGDFYF